MITSILRILLGIMFLISAGLKCYPIEFFELVIQDTVYPSAALSVYLSRFIIGLEFFIGWALIFGWKARFWLLISAILLIVFTIQNFILYLNQGNEGNCGCFGIFLRFTPLESLLKNLIFLFVNGFVLFFSGFDYGIKWKKITTLIGSTLIVLPFILFPPSWYLPEINTESVEKPFPVEVSVLNIENNNFGEGKQLLAFFSTTCLHCVKASYTLEISKESVSQLPPITAFFVGPEKELPNFFKQSNSKPKYYYIDNGVVPKSEIVKITKGKFPVIFYLEDGLVKKEWRGYEISVDNISSFFKSNLTKN